MMIHHERSSGRTPDSTIWHCTGCGWTSGVFKRGEGPNVSACPTPSCSRHNLSFIDFHLETEAPLAAAILGPVK
jgi:hypothetical protein